MRADRFQYGIEVLRNWRDNLCIKPMKNVPCSGKAFWVSGFVSSYLMLSTSYADSDKNRAHWSAPAAGAVERAKSAEWSPVSMNLDMQEMWRKLAAAGKGVFVVKIRKSGNVRVALFSGANTLLPSSSVSRNATLWFDTTDQLRDFLNESGTGVCVCDGRVILAAEEGLVEPFTDQERRNLRLDDPFQWGAQDEISGFAARKVDFPLFSWVKRGTLSWLDSYQTGVFRYCSPDGKTTIITGDPVKVQALVRTEISDQRDLREFVQNRLPYVLVTFLAKRESSIISHRYLAKRAAISPEKWPKKDESSSISESETLLRKYAVDQPQVEIKELEWALTMYVTGPDGSIERWILEGNVAPFTIISIRRVIVEQPGAVVPLPRRKKE